MFKNAHHLHFKLKLWINITYDLDLFSFQQQGIYLQNIFSANQYINTV